MKYAVVRFVDDGSVSEVPINWLRISDGNIQSWWPGFTPDLNSLIENEAKPNARTWELSDIVVEKYCSDLSTARLAATIIVDIPPSKVEMVYAVVRFAEDGSASEIPINWLNILDGCSRCWWPGPTIKNVSTLISKKTKPDKKTWVLCDVEVEKHCENFRKARNLANDIDHITTDEEKMGKGYRKQIAKKYSSYSSDTDVDDIPSIIIRKAPGAKVKAERNFPNDPETALKPPNFNEAIKLNPKKQQSIMELAPPTLKIDAKNMPIRASDNNLEIQFSSSSRDTEHETQLTLNNFDINFNAVQDLTLTEKGQPSNLLNYPDTIETGDFRERAVGDTDHPMVDLATGDRFHSILNNSSVELKQICRCSCAEKCETIIRMIGSLQIDVKGLYDKLKRHELRRLDNTDDSDARLIKQLLPIKDIATIEEFEKLLTTSDEAKSQFKAFILRIAGKTAKEMIERVFARVFSTSVASLVTWKGIRQNFGIHTLYIVEMIKNSVCDNFTDYSEADFEATAKEWIRLGKQRKDREDKVAAKGKRTI